MITKYLTDKIMRFTLDNCYKCTYKLNGIYKEVFILKKALSGDGLSIYVAFNEDIGLINDIKIVDGSNVAVLEDNRQFNKTDKDTLTILLRIDRMEVSKYV